MRSVESASCRKRAPRERLRPGCRSPPLRQLDTVHRRPSPVPEDRRDPCSQTIFGSTIDRARPFDRPSSALRFSAVRPRKSGRGRRQSRRDVAQIVQILRGVLHNDRLFAIHDVPAEGILARHPRRPTDLSTPYTTADARRSKHTSPMSIGKDLLDQLGYDLDSDPSSRCIEEMEIAEVQPRRSVSRLFASAVDLRLESPCNHHPCIVPSQESK